MLATLVSTDPAFTLLRNGCRRGATGGLSKRATTPYGPFVAIRALIHKRIQAQPRIRLNDIEIRVDTNRRT